MDDDLERARAMNVLAGLCQECGGAGVVADMPRIEQYGDPHASRMCRRCRGSGKPSGRLTEAT